MARQYWTRARKDTPLWDFWSEIPPGLVSAIAAYRWLGSGMNEALLIALAAVAGAAVGLGSRFLWNLSFAPIREAKDEIQRLTRERDALQQELLQRSGLYFDFLEVGIGEATSAIDNLGRNIDEAIGIAIAGQLSNRGMPNSVKDWRLAIMIEGRDLAWGTLQQIPPGFTLSNDDSGVFDFVDELLSEQAHKRLDQGDIFSGRLFFLAPIKKDDIKVGDRLVVEFDDIYNNIYRFGHIWEGGSVSFLPPHIGMKKPVPRKADKKRRKRRRRR